RRAPARRGDEPMGTRRERLLLEDLHACRMPGGAVRGADAPTPVPVPPVGLRRPRRRQGRVRSGAPSAAAAGALRRRGRRASGSPRLHPAGRPRVVEQAVIRRLFRWFDERLGAASFARRTLNKVFPDHWSFMLGEIALYCFIILVLTGT